MGPLAWRGPHGLTSSAPRPQLRLAPVSSSSSSSSSSSAGSGRASNSGGRESDSAASGDGGSPLGGGKAARQRRRRQRQAYHLPPIFVSRADLNWGRPPWRFEQSCTPADLGLSTAVPALADAGTDVLVDLRVDGGSGLPGLTVTSAVSALLALRCEQCGAAFETAIDTTVDTWLAGDAASDADLTSASELAFPEGQAVCDLSPVIADAICAELPTVVRCTACVAGAAPVWSSSPAEAGRTSPFGVLKRHAS